MHTKSRFLFRLGRKTAATPGATDNIPRATTNVSPCMRTTLSSDWCADVLDAGSAGTNESSMTKVAVSDALFCVADRCVQIMGGTGVTRDTVVEQVFREVR